MIPKEQGAGGTQTPYDEVRNTIRTGDVLLFRGTSALSRVIQWGSESVYSHAGFAAWWENRLLVFQSSTQGAQVLPLSNVVCSYDGRVDLFRLKEPSRKQVDEAALVTAAVTLLGRKYSSAGLLDLMWRMAMRHFRGIPDANGEPAEVFCSQYVSYCFRIAGLDLVPGTDDGSTSPGDLSSSVHLDEKAVLRDDLATQERRAQVQKEVGPLACPPPK